MYCSNCGKHIRDESIFCPHCGAQLTNNNQQHHTTPEPETKDTSKLKSLARDSLLSPVRAIVVAFIFTFIFKKFLLKDTIFTLDSKAYITSVFTDSLIGDVVFPLVILIVILIVAKLKNK